MKKFILVLLAGGLASLAGAQAGADSTLLIALNQQIDNHVVIQNIAGLDKLYAEDFVFSHGSGKVEGKQSWLKSVAKGGFLSRLHDSVTVELHEHVAIVKGKLSVKKKTAVAADRYHLKYIRVYVYRNRQWQMISHTTTFEVHEPL